METTHILFVSVATPGHFIPSFHFCNSLSHRGIFVTFASSLSVLPRLPHAPPSDHLSFASFSDGFDDGFKPGHNISHFLSEFQRHGSAALKDLILSAASSGHRPFTFVVYSTLIPWVAEVARSFHLPSALLWNQAAMVFATFYHFFNGYENVIRETCEDSSRTVKLPGLPLLGSRDFHSHLHSSTSFLPLFRKHFQVLEQEPYAKVLVNSFESLEIDAIRGVAKLNLIAVGPLLPSVFTTDISTEWLNSNPKSSVVYVSFGSIAMLSKQQTEEIARGLLAAKQPFLWVMQKIENEGEDDGILRFREELERKGKIVPWCSQIEVLSNPAIGCFLTHCGWNSTMETLACGVPAVAFPQWFDQGTSAKIIQDFSKTGVRLKVNEAGLVEGEEIQRCLVMVMGEEGKEMRKNAAKWKKLAKEAAMDGGSSEVNLKKFVDDVCNCARR